MHKLPTMPFIFALLVLAGVVGAGDKPAPAADKPAQEEFTYTSSFDGTGPLKALAIYDKTARRRPIMVVQHGYGGNRQKVAYSAARLADKGFFSLCLDTRGNGGSAGRQDDGGIEIMDIYDGIQAAIKRYGDKVDGANVSIVGYSNGGGNVHFAVVRFPFLFRGAMSFFGIPDYGRWNANGKTYKVTQFVGGTVPQLPDKYLVRNSILAVANLSGTRFHLAYDAQETICPVPMQEAFIKAVKDRNYPLLFVNLSKPGDPHRWTHGYNSGHLNVAEDAFVEDLLKNPSAPLPMPDSGELVVLGFLVTPRFNCVLGKGDDAAARVKYEFKDGTARFNFTPLTSNSKAKVVLTLAEGALPLPAGVTVNGQPGGSIGPGGKLTAEAALDATLEFKAAGR
jgi:pimeloyl-ACP methyl ester carboxylesterase